MDENEQALIDWVNTFGLEPEVHGITELCDGIILTKVCQEICPDSFDVGSLNASTSGNWVLASGNIKKLIRMLSDYYETVLRKEIDMSTIDVNAIVRDNDLDELLGLVEVIVGATVMCSDRGRFIQQITSMDHISQAVLKALIQRVMERVSDAASATPASTAAPAGSAGQPQEGGSNREPLAVEVEESEDYIRSQELVRHLQEERQRLLQTVEDLESRNATLAADKRKAELQLAEHKQDQNPAASAVGAGGASASSLAALNETLKLELEDLRRDLDVQLVENQNIRQSLKAFQQKYEAVKEMQAKLEMENQQLNDELDVTRAKASQLTVVEGKLDKYHKKMEEMIPLKKQNAEYLDKMDKYVDQIYELESANKSITRMIDQYRDKNVELEREKYEALSAKQMQEFEVARLTSELTSTQDAKRLLEDELNNVKDELQALSEANAAMEALQQQTANATMATETESVASLREKVKRLEHELKAARAGESSSSPSLDASTGGAGGGGASSAEVALLNADLANAHKLRKEREDELVAVKKQVSELTMDLKKANRTLHEQEQALSNKAQSREIEQKLAASQNTVHLLEDRLKERETTVSKLEQDKSKLEAYAKKAIANFKEKYMTLLQSVKLENKSLKSQLQTVTTKHEQDIETTRREERLLLSTMYELATKMADRNIQENIEISQQNSNQTVIGGQRVVSST